MQYMLTEQEYLDLKNGIESERLKLKDTIQRLCVEVAMNKPVKFWGNKTADVWGCPIHSDSDETYSYCDECPVQNDCPEEYKRWSK